MIWNGSLTLQCKLNDALHTSKVLTQRSDTSKPADKQADQVMAIFPVIHGQKPDPEDAPKHERASEPSTSQDAPEGATSTTQDSGGDLIDFGQEDQPAATEPAAAKPAASKPVDAEPAKTADEIEKMLSSTGKPAEGPLIDFAQDLKKGLPQ